MRVHFKDNSSIAWCVTHMLSAACKRVNKMARQPLLVIAVALTCTVIIACLLPLRYKLFSTKQGFPKPKDGGTPVKMTLYYETLCPDCYNFATKQLFPVWSVLKDTDILDLTLVPYGKATTTAKPDGTFTFDCQHGVHECEGNTAQACIIKHYPDLISHMKILNCFYADFFDTLDWRKSLSNCANTGVDVATIATCTSGKEGQELLAAAGKKTIHDLQYVPWIVINGKRNEDAEYDLLKVVCKAYTGDPPPECK